MQNKDLNLVTLTGAIITISSASLLLRDMKLKKELYISNYLRDLLYSTPGIF